MPAARAAKVAKRGGGGKQRADASTGLMEADGGDGEGGEDEEDTPCAVCGGVQLGLGLGLGHPNPNPYP